MSQANPVSLLGGKVRSLTCIITLAAQAAGSITLTGVILPKGSRFLFGHITSSVTLASATIAVGISGTTAKYKAAAVFTTTDQPVLFGKAAVVGAELTAAEQLLLTSAVVALPASGTLVVTVFYVDNS